MVQPTAFWNHCLPISVLVNAAVVGRMPARITSMPLRTTIRTIWTSEAIRPDQAQNDQDEDPDPGLVRSSTRMAHRLGKALAVRGTVNDRGRERIRGDHQNGDDPQPKARTPA